MQTSTDFDDAYDDDGLPDQAGGGLRPWPQPPWLDPGDRVRIRRTGLPGLVISADLLAVGWVYEVLHQGGISSFSRDDLAAE